MNLYASGVTAKHEKQLKYLPILYKVIAVKNTGRFCDNGLVHFAKTGE